MENFCLRRVTNQLVTGEESLNTDSYTAPNLKGQAALLRLQNDIELRIISIHHTVQSVSLNDVLEGSEVKGKK